MTSSDSDKQRNSQLGRSRRKYARRVKNRDIEMQVPSAFSNAVDDMADRLSEAASKSGGDFPTALFAPLLQESLSPLIISDMRGSMTRYEKALIGCESYLEQLMLIGLLTVANQRSIPLLIVDRNQQVINIQELIANAAVDNSQSQDDDPLYLLAIQPQVTVAQGDTDRVDFTLTKVGPAEESMPASMLLQLVTRSSPHAWFDMPHAVVAVECDGSGHDIASDTKRDGIWLNSRKVKTSRHSSEDLRSDYLGQASTAFRLLENEFSDRFP